MVEVKQFALPNFIRFWQSTTYSRKMLLLQHNYFNGIVCVYTQKFFRKMLLCFCPVSLYHWMGENKGVERQKKLSGKMHYAFYGQWKIAAYYRDSRKQLPHFFHLLAELHRKNIRMIFISRVCISFSRIHWEHGSCKHIIIYAFHFFMLSFYYLPTKGRYLNSGNHFNILNIDNIKSRFGTLMTFLNSFFAREMSQTSHYIARKMH